jgi:DNA-directed RNA polymerase subunit alpha
MTTDTSPAPAPSPIDDSARSDWFASVPDDWAGWLAFRAEVVETPHARTSLRNHMSEKLEAGKDDLALGLGLYAAGETARALSHLQAASGDLATLLAGLAQAAASDTAGALKTLGGLTGSAKVGTRACLETARIHARLRDGEALEADVAAVRSAGGSEADVGYVTGLAAEAAADHDGALAALTQAVDDDPAHVEATFELASLLDRMGDDDAALELLEPFRTGALPAHTGALINLGILYEDREQHDWARTCFKMVSTADPMDARARRYLEEAEASLDQFYDESRERRADKQNAVLRIPVTDFELSVRARNCLQKMHIHTLGDLVSRTESDLLAFKNFGETSLEEVKEILDAKGLRLGMMPTAAGGTATAGAEAAPAGPEGDVKDVLISELDLSVRSRAALATLGITKVGELQETTETTLLSCKNFGQTSLDEIRSKLRHLGLELGG